MEQGQSTLVLRRFGPQLHGATVLTLHSETVRHGAAFGLDVVEQLTARSMVGHVLWSTSCKPSEVTATTFRQLRDAGLYLIRLDVESRTPHREVALAVQTLRPLGILIEYDLDLFAGLPRFATIRTNLALLRAIVADGTTPATVSFSSQEGDCSPWLQLYRRRLPEAVRPWLDADGLSVRLGEAWAELAIAERLVMGMTSVAGHRIALQRLTLRCNTELLTLIAQSTADFESTGDTGLLDPDRIGPRCAQLTDRLVVLRNNLLVGDEPQVRAPLSG